MADERSSADEHLSAAAVCYHFGKILFVDDLDAVRDARRSGRDADHETKGDPKIRDSGAAVGAGTAAAALGWARPGRRH
jgi:hypothetical protein